MKKSQKAGFAHRNLPLLLLQTRERVMELFRPILNAHDLTEQQWRIIRALLEADALEPREIGDICRLSSPSLAGMLSRMDDLGLVVRRRLPHDQRRVRVSLTAKGRTIAARIAPLVEETYRRMETALGADLMDRLYCVLDEVMTTPIQVSAQVDGNRVARRGIQ